MARTTPANIAKIIEVDPSVSLTFFIDMANELTTEVCGEVGYADTRLEKIERLLAAHFYASMPDMRASSETFGSLQTAFQSKVDLGFNLTHYGQAAMRLDTAGGLARLDACVKAGKIVPKIGMVWLGKECEAVEEDE